MAESDSIKSKLFDAYRAKDYEEVVKLIKTNEFSEDTYKSLLYNAINDKIWPIAKLWKDFNLFHDVKECLTVVDVTPRRPSIYDVVEIRDLFGEFVREDFYFRVFHDMLYLYHVDIWHIKAVALYGGENFYNNFSRWYNEEGKELDVRLIIKRYGITFIILLMKHDIIYEEEIMRVINLYDNTIDDYVFVKYLLEELQKHLGMDFINEILTHFVEHIRSDLKILNMLIDMGAKSRVAPFEIYSKYHLKKEHESLFEALKKIQLI